MVRPDLAAAPDFAARFHRDAQAAGQVRGPYLVPVVGSGNEGSRYWFASSYVPGLPLRAAVAAGGPLPTGVVLRLVAGLAEALQAVHHAGVVHGGLRPAHVLLAADGPRLKSYGLGWVGDGEEATAFRSPEQAAGNAAVPATDVFALGQIAAYASIGAAPFGDGARVQQAEADLNELPGQLREIVTRCLIKDPALRPSLAQITTMCAQAAPERPRATSWLPAPLMAAILPTIPPPAAAPGGGIAAAAVAPPPPPAAPPGAAPAAPGAGATGASAAEAASGGAQEFGASAPEGAPTAGEAGADPGTGEQAAGERDSRTPGGAADVADAAGSRAKDAVDAPVRAAPAAPPLPPAPAAPPGGYLLHPQQWPRAPYVHVPLPLPRRGRRKAAAAVAVAAGLAVGRDRGRGARRRVLGPRQRPGGGAARPPPCRRSRRPPGQGGGRGGGARTPRRARRSRGCGCPRDTASPSTPTRRSSKPAPLAGTSGSPTAADAFTVPPRRGTLALLADRDPSTLGACLTTSAAQVTSVARPLVGPGARLCVRSADGTTTLVTVRQLTPPGDPKPSAVLDLTVWRPAAATATATPVPTVRRPPRRPPSRRSPRRPRARRPRPPRPPPRPPPSRGLSVLLAAGTNSA